MLLRSLLVVLACLSLALAVTPAQAAQVQLAWDAPAQATGTPVPNLAGYKLYYGSQSGQYQTPIPVGLTTTYTVTNLSAGQTYYFAVKDYDSTGTESALSNEVSVTLPTNTSVNEASVTLPTNTSVNEVSVTLPTNTPVNEVSVTLPTNTSVNEASVTLPTNTSVAGRRVRN